MWKLKSIYIKNIVSFREARLEVEQGVATLIFGRNEDNASQPCNGSGKSSLIEAIAFALTGEQLRKVKTIEEIINDNADEAFVSLELENDYDNTTLIIDRQISRNSPQIIVCHKYDADGNEIEKDKTIQPTVADYNKFILSEIGLSKDDIYNNYILCDNKYESFFDCSDKNKKEVINRFSNGQIIDESIERVHKDMEPVEEELRQANSQVINIKGSISAIENELANVDEKKINAINERAVRIERIDNNILQCRERIADYEDKLGKAEKRMNILESLKTRVEEAEKSDISLLDAYGEFKVMCEENELGTISDFVKISEKYKGDLVNQQNKLESLKADIVAAENSWKACSAAYEDGLKQCTVLQSEHEKLNKDALKKVSELNEELDKIDRDLDNLEGAINGNKNCIADCELSIKTIKTMIEGAVKCPNCGHEFDISNKKSVDDLKSELAEEEKSLDMHKKDGDDWQKEFDNLNKKYIKTEKEAAGIEKDIASRKKELESLNEASRTLMAKVSKAELAIEAVKKEIILCQNEFSVIDCKIEVLRQRLFGEITGLIEGRIVNGKNYIEQQLSSIDFENGKITQYRVSKKELQEAPEIDFETSLNESLKKYQADLENAEKTAQNVQNEYDKLKGQEVNFTMFKSYIARKKIDALSYIVNDFLEKIGSDIRLRLEGFTMTKSGKLRDKISVQVMRDGIDCGSYHKFSGGEKARLNLACILSLHTLTNSNCEDGKGLDFIIIDELLDKSDEMGMTTYCDALNKLKQTSLLITQGAVSEGYPHKLLITKRQGVSTISN